MYYLLTYGSFSTSQESRNNRDRYTAVIASTTIICSSSSLIHFLLLLLLFVLFVLHCSRSLLLDFEEVIFLFLLLDFEEVIFLFLLLVFEFVAAEDLGWASGGGRARHGRKGVRGVVTTSKSKKKEGEGEEEDSVCRAEGDREEGKEEFKR